MMPQMEPERQYGRYEGERQQQEYTPPHYEAPSYGPAQTQERTPYDDEFIDMLAQRIAQRLTQGPSGKINLNNRGGDRPSVGHRLALAIVSIALLVPLAGIIFGVVGGVFGLFAFGGVCLTLFLINAVFNNSRW
jgi:hypothetical protein